MKTFLSTFRSSRDVSRRAFPGAKALSAGLFAFFFSFYSFGQAEQWENKLGGTGPDLLKDLQQTRDGGYILGGTSYADKSGDKSQNTHGDCVPEGNSYWACAADFWVVKLDAKGRKQWDKTFGGSGHEVFGALVQTRDGGYLLGGTSLSGQEGDKTGASRGESDYWVVKIDARGNKQWDKTFGGAARDELTSLRQTRDGGYILGGNSYSFTGGEKSQDNRASCAPDKTCTPDYWVVKLDQAGNKIWDKTIGGRAFDHLAAVEQTPDGGYALGGYSYSGVGGDKTAIKRNHSADFWLVKLSATGAKEWDKSYGSSGPSPGTSQLGRDLLTAMDLTQDGGFILGGYVKSAFDGDITGNNDGDSDFWVLKLDAQGSKQWDKTFGGENPDYLSSVRQTREGGYVLAGMSTSGKFVGDKTWTYGDWVIKLDAAGNKQWDKVFTAARRVQQTSDGGYILGGETLVLRDDQYDTDFSVVKVAGGFDVPRLSIRSFSPEKGLPGTTVTIKGNNLRKTQSVWFYGAKLKKAKFRIISNTEIQAVVPHSAKTGVITLVSVDGSRESRRIFTVRYPVISSFSPGQGPVGTTVTLRGDRLTTASQVFFNEVPATQLTVESDEKITVVVPAGATTGPVRVLLQGGGKATSAASFVVLPASEPALAGDQRLRQEAPAALPGRQQAGTAVFPNPFRQQLTYRFSLPDPQPVSVKVFDLLGREVAVLFRGQVPAHQVQEVLWRPPAHQPAGIYLIRLQAPGQDRQERILLTR